MRKECIKEAESVEAAVLAACEELGIREEEAEVEVLVQPQKKVLGLFGGSEAKVRVTAKDGKNVAELAAAYLKEILTAMNAGDVTITATDREEGCTLHLEGEDLGFIIGRRGETLDALQHLVSLVANRADKSYYRVSIDVGDYREKREASLTTLATRHAETASRTGRRISLEPMNPYERRIIHTAVQAVEGATSWSVGSDDQRHVIIGPSDDNPNKDKFQSNRSSRGGRGRRSGGNGGRNGERGGDRSRRNGGSRGYEVAADRPVRAFVPRSNPMPTADGASVPDRRTESEKSDVLYSRIDL